MVDDITGDMMLELVSLGGNTSDMFRYMKEAIRTI